MVSYEEARAIVIQRVRTWLASLPESEKSMPRLVVGTRVYSPLDILREVEMNSPTGRSFVAQQASALGILIE